MDDTGYHDEIDLRRYAAVVWRWKWLLVACTLLAAAAAFVVSRLQTPVYEASTALLVSQAPDARTSDYNALLMSERLTRTYSEMLTQRPVLEQTLERSGVVMDLEDFHEAVSVEPVRDTQLIRVKVEDTSPVLAARLANTLAQVFAEHNQALEAGRFAASKASLEAQLAALSAQIAQVEADIQEAQGRPAELERLQANLASYQASYTGLLQSYEELRRQEAGSSSNLIQVDPAVPPEEPVRPRTLLNTALAAVVGGMLAVGAVFLIEYLDNTIRSPEQLERELGLPVLGTIAHIEGNHAEGKPHVAAYPLSPIAEAFRGLRTNIQFAGVDAPIRTLLVTSPGPEEGKSSVAANLAAITAQGDRPTIVLEADLRRPRVHRMLGLSRRSGLSDLFVQPSLSLDGALQATEIDGLRGITSGELPPNPAELLGSARMGQILQALQQEADLVILDSSPAAVVTDPVVLAEKVDAVLLVVQPGKTELAAALHAVTALRRAGGRVIGAVFNNVSLKRGGYYGSYRYQYLYSYESDERPSEV